MASHANKGEQSEVSDTLDRSSEPSFFEKLLALSPLIGIVAIGIVNIL